MSTTTATASEVQLRALTIVKRLKLRDEEWREDRNRNGSDYHCQHGTYVGHPWGPDFMCGLCEDGVSVYQEALGYAEQELRREQHEARMAEFRREMDELARQRQPA